MSLATSVFSACAVAAIPIVQIGVLYRHFWVSNRKDVDRKNCKCSCFDAVFKGSYESPGESMGYKHVYFNATSETMYIWCITILYFILAYESLKILLRLLVNRSLRPLMAGVFCLNIYPHVYAWFAFFNYYNDGFFKMFNHQVFFAVTEIISSYAILKSCDRNVTRNRLLYLVIIGTAFVHVIIGGVDQFVVNLFFNKGKSHQVWRDLGLSIPDIVTGLVPTVDFIIGRKEDQNISKNGNIQPFNLTLLSRLGSSQKVAFIYVGLILVIGFMI